MIQGKLSGSAMFVLCSVIILGSGFILKLSNAQVQQAQDSANNNAATKPASAKARQKQMQPCMMPTPKPTPSPKTSPTPASANNESIRVVRSKVAEETLTQDLVIAFGKSIDSDCDGISNADDNCTFISNPKQEDRNKNGFGDACDTKKIYRKEKRRLKNKKNRK